MDALVVEQYRYFLAALAAGLLASLVVAFVLARRGAAGAAVAPGADEPDRTAQRQVLPHVMLLLVALAVGTGILLLVPAAMIVKYFPGRPVLVLLLFAVALLAAPLLYAWRARPFS